MPKRPSRAELVEQNEALIDKLEDVRDQLDEALSEYESNGLEESNDEQ